MSILLLDDSEPVREITRRRARVLLAKGRATVLLGDPPRLRMTPDHARKPAPRNRDAAQGPIYSNILAVSPDDVPMFRCGLGRFLWYVDRGLATVIALDPVTMRLTFTPKGPGHVGDPFYLDAKENRCVVCGAREDLNRHHVVPFCFRRHFPVEFKTHSIYDIVPLCVDCHYGYEIEAERFKRQLCREQDTPFYEAPSEDKVRNRAIRAASALVRLGDAIPPDRREILKQQIEAFLGRRCEPDDVPVVASLERQVLTQDPQFGSVIVSRLDMQELVIRWRKHFVESTKPKFLPEHWDVDRPFVSNVISR